MSEPKTQYWLLPTVLTTLILIWPTTLIVGLLLWVAQQDPKLARILIEGSVGTMVTLLSLLLVVISLSFGGLRAWRTWAACLGLACSIFLMRSVPEDLQRFFPWYRSSEFTGCLLEF